LFTAFPGQAMKGAGGLEQRLGGCQHLLEREERAYGEVSIAGFDSGASGKRQCGRFLQDVAQAGEGGDNGGIG
jgi:hypothetical protein